jgi:hypothetical protein
MEVRRMGLLDIDDFDIEFDVNAFRGLSEKYSNGADNGGLV